MVWLRTWQIWGRALPTLSAMRSWRDWRGRGLSLPELVRFKFSCNRSRLSSPTRMKPLRG
ncbi:hypothetical protein PFAS1_16020 [Pseudomonas frederiksbergensis]|nr:hypothetical protein PFAS1_16020 [Pseudomonas frederiksbergensis]